MPATLIIFILTILAVVIINLSICYKKVSTNKKMTTVFRLIVVTAIPLVVGCAIFVLLGEFNPFGYAEFGLGVGVIVYFLMALAPYVILSVLLVKYYQKKILKLQYN